MSPEEAQQKAVRAKQLLDDPLLSEALTAINDALIGAVAMAKTPEEAFKAAVAMQVFRMVKDSLESYITTAKVMEYNSKKTFVDRVLGR